VIGDRTHVGGGSLIDAAERIEIGNDVLISFDVVIMDHDSHALEFEKRRHDVADWLEGKKDWSHVPRRQVRIADKAWIGVRAMILKGVELGEGCVVAAGAVVTKDVPPWTLVAGVPARVVRSLPVSGD
jgi:acetyltransferase-like isoleucine patch superfamily enzyme